MVSILSRFFAPAALPGWDERLRAFLAATANGAVYEAQTPSGVRVGGCPLEWALAEERDGKVVPTKAVSTVSGRVVVGAFPVQEDGTPDLSSFGVRCARCGCALHVTEAHMKTTVDVPRCPRCRPIVEDLLRR